MGVGRGKGTPGPKSVVEKAARPRAEEIIAYASTDSKSNDDIIRRPGTVNAALFEAPQL